jgi:hypothetical protein
MNRKHGEPYSREAWAAADRAREIMEDARAGTPLGGGISTVNGGEYVEEISWAVRGKSGAYYTVGLVPREMEARGFISKPRDSRTEAHNGEN